MASILTPGTILKARYKIERIIYETHLVNIYYAHDVHMKGKVWAVRETKLVAADINEKINIISKFKREASIIASISHPLFAKVVDFFVDDDYLYIVREYVSGSDLNSLLIKQRAPFQEEEVIAWAIQLADLFTFLYAKKLPSIFFREFNMGNLISMPKSSIKATDMGLAKMFYADTGLEGLSHLGASEYAAPEQYAENGFFDIKSLVYSLGAFMYHALSNVNPSLSPFDLQPISLLNPSLSRQTQDVIKKATETDPKRRYSSLQEMKRHLSGRLKGTNQGSSIKTDYNPPSGSSGVQNMLFIISVLSLLGLLGFLGYYFFLK